MCDLNFGKSGAGTGVSSTCTLRTGLIKKLQKHKAFHAAFTTRRCSYEVPGQNFDTWCLFKDCIQLLRNQTMADTEHPITGAVDTEHVGTEHVAVKFICKSHYLTLDDTHRSTLDFHRNQT